MLLFLDSAEILAVDHGVGYMRMISVFYLLCFTGNAFVGYFRGVGRMRVLVIGTTLHIAVRALLSHLLVNRMGLEAVALATGVGWLLLFVYQSASMLQLRRKKKGYIPL